MNTNKLNISQFNEIKNRLSLIIQKANDYYEQHHDDPEYNEEEFAKMLEVEYIGVQNQLLSYNLSDIPFEAWEGINILSDKEHPADFSGTGANIDFSLVEYYSGANFRGCNVRNLEKLGRFLDEKCFDEKTIAENSNLFLSDSIPSNVKEKYYSSELSIEDISGLSGEQIDELAQKNVNLHFQYESQNYLMYETLGLNRIVELYNHSKEEYDLVNSFLNHNSPLGYVSINSGGIFVGDFIEKMRSASIQDMRKICNEYARNNFLANKYGDIDTSKLPSLFIADNADILLLQDNVSQDLREKYYTRKLTLDDVIQNAELFENIPVSNYMEYNYEASRIAEKFGENNFAKLLKKHPDVIKYIVDNGKAYNFTADFSATEDFEKSFTLAVKQYFMRYEMPENFVTENDGQRVYNVPEWLSSMNFQFSEKIETLNDLLQYTDNMVILNGPQNDVIDLLGIDNILKFEQETGFFSHKAYEYSRDLEMFGAFTSYIRMNGANIFSRRGIDFKNGSLEYGEFKDVFAECLNYMRSSNIFTDYPDYNWLKGEFREKHPEIFMSENASEDLVTAFYRNRITPEFIASHKEEIKFLLDKDLIRTVRADMKLTTAGLAGADGSIIPSSSNFIEEYVSRYGNEKFLQLCAKYGGILSNLEISSLHNEIDNEQLIEKSLRNAIVNKIIKGNINHSYLIDVPELVSEHPEIFADFSGLTNISKEERERLETAFYSKNMSFDDIKKYPELISLLKDKNLLMAFSRKDGTHHNGRVILSTGYGRNNGNQYSDLELLEVFGNEKFLQLCSKYGRYMDGIAQHLSQDITIRNGKYVDFGSVDYEVSFEKISSMIENIIKRESVLGNIAYLPSDAPEFLKQSHPELFLSEDAPEQLKNYFYRINSNYPMTFMLLQQHKEWLPYLKDKSITTSLLKNPYLKDDLVKFIKLFGEEKAVKLGINRAETVTEMMKSHQVELMKNWYEKTGGKFIPDFVVMQNFSIDEADKFLVSASNWSNLMRIQSFSKTPEARDAMLKLAYSFGAFDQDQRGFKKLQELLTGLPKKINPEQAYVFEQIDQQINQYSQKNVFYGVRSKVRMDANGNMQRILMKNDDIDPEKAYQQMIEHIKNNQFMDLFDTSTLLNLLESLKKEKVNIDFSKDIFSQLYRKNEDGSFSLTINSQSCPKSSQAIRGILENFREVPILTPNKAHQLFGGFELKYNADFREFLLSNMDKIIENPEYVSLVASVQRQFNDIKAVNSNRALTWELAVSYVQSNKYTSVNVGNERVAEISAIAGYSQADFNTLQQIYNYGKQRTFSSIPRIEQTEVKKSGKYTYETLRLDDPLAMAIGTLTDCCQELGNCAEVCMEHSMVDKNGRVFVIKDEFGNIVAQSWVWRNKDVLCFDNIEIPDKAFARATKEHPELGRKGFTDEVFEIYKKAAQDLIVEDEKVYKELLESGKITQEQYDGLRLGKVTVGLGYNDIAESLKQNSSVDKGKVARPLPFEEPVRLQRGLYTNDSTTQYVLEERPDRQVFEGDTLPVHNDTFIEYTDSNFSEKSLLSLEKLEIVTKEDPRYLETSVGDYADSEHLVTALARNYGLNPDTTKVVMNPNFAIIYDTSDEKLRVADLLYNTRIDNELQQMDIENQVVMQIRLAFEQIAGNREIDISSLESKQQEMYAKAAGLTQEMDMERGVGHAR